MSEQFQKVLFTPFSQESRNENSDLRGSGLGLAIIKQLVDLMGGTISVDSKPGVGSAFTVECIVDCVPSDVAPTTDQQAEEDKDALLDGRHVLLCEDHPLNQEIAKALLQEKGMTVDLAENGQRGVEVFSQSPIGYYDAILMDIRMIVGAALAHNFSLAGNPDSVNDAGEYVVGGIGTAGKIAVALAIAVLLVVSFVNLNREAEKA